MLLLWTVLVMILRGDLCHTPALSPSPCGSVGLSELRARSNVFIPRKSCTCNNVFPEKKLYANHKILLDLQLAEKNLPSAMRRAMNTLISSNSTQRAKFHVPFNIL